MISKNVEDWSILDIYINNRKNLHIIYTINQILKVSIIKCLSHQNKWLNTIVCLLWNRSKSLPV